MTSRSLLISAEFRLIQHVALSAAVDLVAGKLHEGRYEGFKQHFMTGHLRRQQRFDLLHLFDDILDRRAAQLVIEQIT